MNTIFTRLKQAFPFVTSRAATEDDFFQFCAKRGVEVIFSPDVRQGIYVVFRGRHFIFLSTALRGWMLLYVMFHELGHYLFHVPRRTRNAAFAFNDCGRNHLEAEATAALLLLPVRDLDEVLRDGSYADDDRLRALIATRLELIKLYGV
jgi:Zn-dependent peptidase ImmA (M78 family)